MLSGDESVSSRNEPVPWPLEDRVDSVVSGHWQSQAPVTEIHRQAYQIAAADFGEFLASLKQLAADLANFETQADEDLAPWTPGRIPDWSPE